MADYRQQDQRYDEDADTSHRLGDEILGNDLLDHRKHVGNR